MAEAKRERGKGEKEKEQKKEGEKRKKPRKENMIEVKRVAEKWKIWDNEEKAVKLEAEAKKLVPECFHK